MAFSDRLWARLRGGGAQGALARGSGVLLGVRVLGLVLGYVSQLLLIRWAGTEAFGVYVYAFSWISFIALFAGLGFPEAVLRFLPVYAAESRWGLMRGLMRGGRAVALLVGVGVSGVGAVALWRWDPGLAGPYTVPLLVGLGVVPFVALVSVQSRMLLAQGRVAWASVPSNLLRKVLVIGGAGLLFAGGGTLTGTRLVLITGSAVLVVGLVYAVVLRYTASADVRRAAPVYTMPDWLRVSLPLLMSAGLWAVLSQTDLLVLGFFEESTQLGMYSVIVRLAGMLLFFLAAVNGVAAPMFARLYAEGDTPALQALADAASKWMFFPALGLGLLLLLFAEPLLGLFSPVYKAGQGALMILVGAYLVNVACGLPGRLLDMAGYQNDTLRVVAWCSALNVLLNLILIPSYGIHGAALATGIAMILWNLWLYRLAYRRVGVRSTFLARWFSR